MSAWLTFDEHALWLQVEEAAQRKQRALEQQLESMRVHAEGGGDAPGGAAAAAAATADAEAARQQVEQVRKQYQQQIQTLQAQLRAERSARVTGDCGACLGPVSYCPVYVLAMAVGLLPCCCLERGFCNGYGQFCCMNTYGPYDMACLVFLAASSLVAWGMDGQSRRSVGADTLKIYRPILNCSVYWGMISHLWLGVPGS